MWTGNGHRIGYQTASGHLSVPPESKEPYAADVLAAAARRRRRRSSRATRRSALRCCRCCTSCSRVDGYVTGRGIDFCAEVLDLTQAEVSGVATFYTQYKRHPNGEYTVGVCTNTLCAIMGGDQIWERVSEHLGIGHDETTADGKITLERVECNAACDYAPVVMANWEFFDNQTPESTTPARRRPARRQGRPAHPRRRASVCTFKEVSRVLAGFPDGLADEGVGAGPASLEGLRIANERGWTAPPARTCAKAEHQAAATLRRGGGRTAHLHRQRGERTGRRRPATKRRRRREVTAMSTTLTPILTKFWDDPQSWTLETYEPTTATRHSRRRWRWSRPTWCR